jgi:hypothetical protein
VSEFESSLIKLPNQRFVQGRRINILRISRRPDLRGQLCMTWGPGKSSAIVMDFGELLDELCTFLSWKLKNERAIFRWIQKLERTLH